MGLTELLEGESLTGRQAAIIFFTFLVLVIVAGILLVALRDVFWFAV
ncbi:hypothetical protein [Natronorubrum texcoconense]|uniref:Uncharacterized protein n=1 Tax=Natronorubrum texcoconense TaxID=1095776 RepID=A0A1G8T2C9_9EURY|nr:hypothetical protein [Natronorubrum texcoconense]SDJ35571.1 hypothetical protein SAMN04515672_0291 [Natronorubrum texcoconense]